MSDTPKTLQEVAPVQAPVITEADLIAAAVALRQQRAKAKGNKIFQPPFRPGQHWTTIHPDGSIHQQGFCSNPDHIDVQHVPDKGKIIKHAVGEEVPKPHKHRYDFTTGAFVVSVDAMKKPKLEELAKACKTTILGGFQCNALGTLLTYPSQLQDQSNYVRVAQVGGTLRTTDGQIRTYTAAQGLVVLKAFAAMSDAAHQQLNQLTTQVKNATTEDAVASIKWS